MNDKTSEHVSTPWNPNGIPDNAEKRFEDATNGYPLDQIHFLHEVAVVSAFVRTLSELELWREALRGCGAGKQVAAVLRLIGQDGRNRLAVAVDPRDFVRANLTLLLGIPPGEVEDLATVLVEYGKAESRTLGREIYHELKRTPAGTALLMATDVIEIGTREAAKIEGKSHVAKANEVRRIRNRLPMCRR